MSSNQPPVRNTRDPGIRRRVVIELLVLGVATTTFLVLFPRRPFLVDAGLACFAVTILVLSVRDTREVIWGQFPCETPAATRARQSLRVVGPVTGIVVLVLLAAGLVLGYQEGGWNAAWRRIGNPDLLLALAVYLPWALAQQTLFQFYLLGRLRTLFPVPVAVTGTGFAYALVHLPDVRIALLTAVAGVFWSGVYNRHRSLVPLAISHAVLGATFYYWIYGQDLAGVWTARW